MQRCWALVTPGSSYWVARWMRSLGGSPAGLLAVPGALEEARAIASGSTAKVVPLDGPEQALPDSLSSIALPADVGVRPFVTMTGRMMPDLEPVYPWLRYLRAHGIGRVRLINGLGEQPLHIGHVLDEFRDRHAGKRCFIVGNGPSLNQIDMTRLRDEVTFGSNQCFLGFRRWGFAFNYWAVADALQIEENGPLYERDVPAEIIKFVPLSHLTLLRMDRLCPVPMCTGLRRPLPSVEEPLNAGRSVTFLLIQLAVLMGCNPIILVGVDHRYPLREPWLSRAKRQTRERLLGPFRTTQAFRAMQMWRAMNARPTNAPTGSPSPKWGRREMQGETHFDQEYTRVRFALPQLGEAARDFQAADRWAAQRGVTILNATPHTALHAFRKTTYESLF